MQYEKIIVPVSGGKDSQLCLALALEQFPKEKIVAVHQSTGYDHPLTYKHLDWMEEFYDIKIEYTQSDKYKDVFDLIEKQQYFPNNVARSCTGELKQVPFGKWLIANNFLTEGACLIWMGMRSDESNARSTKYGDLNNEDVFSLSDLSGKYGKKFSKVCVSLPIVSFTEKQVFEELAKRGHKVNELYAKGAARVGCFPCLLAKKADWEMAAKDETGREHIKKLLELEDKFTADTTNTRKLIKIHQTRDIKHLLATGSFSDKVDDSAQCGWCSI
jgi:3'-phosphoadenosine 5'-phosphosulfate sulfotransferase (PAPS reductase)/FAD synthetase